MEVNYSRDFIIKCCDAYNEQEVHKVVRQSNFNLIFTDDKVYNLDDIVLLRRRDVGNMPSAVHVIDKEEDNYADVMLVFLAIDHILFNEDPNLTYVYEQNRYHRAVRPVTGINNIVRYLPYDNITDIPNYIALLQTVLDPNENGTLLDYLYSQIPSHIREKDGFIQMNTQGDDNYFDILDILDPDDVI